MKKIELVKGILNGHFTFKHNDNSEMLHCKVAKTREITISEHEKL